MTDSMKDRMISTNDVRNAFRKITVIYWRDVTTLWRLPVNSIFMAILFFLLSLLFFASIVQQDALSTVTFQTLTLTPLLGNLHFLFIFLGPLYAIKIMNEETTSKMIDEYVLSPASLFSFLVARWLSLMTYMFAILFLSLIYPLASSVITDGVDWGSFLTGLFGIYLAVGFYFSIALFISSIFIETQNFLIIATLLSWVIILALFFLQTISQGLSNLYLQELFFYLGPNHHFQLFVSGSIRSYSVVYFLSFSFLFLWSALEMLNAKKTLRGP